jgi:cation diffusion facilitator family transporter
MHNDKIEHANTQIRAVTIAAIIANVTLAIVKAVVGLLAGSMSLLFDAIHSISDTATDIVVLFGISFGSKEPDIEHPYGHGRAETFSAAIVAIVLVIVGCFMIQKASMAVARPTMSEAGGINQIVLWVAILSIIAKEALYWVSRKIAVKTHSASLYANAWHHRSDALSSVAVAVGFIAMKFGFDHGDYIAAIVVGLMIILVGVKILGGCLHEFAERSVDTGTVAQIEKIIASEGRIRHWHKLRTRSAGREIFLDLHILVDPVLTITEAHEIAEALEDTMHAQITRPVNITIHIEPDSPELRK